jgi:hypothetical protein
MMVLDHVGDQEAIVYAQLGQQPLVRTTETSPEPGRGTLSCLSARPPDLAFWAGTRPRVVSVSPSIVPFLYSKRTAAARSLVSRYGRLHVLSPLRAHSRGPTRRSYSIYTIAPCSPHPAPRPDGVWTEWSGGNGGLTGGRDFVYADSSSKSARLK